MRGMELYRIENARDMTLDIVLFLAECASEEFENGFFQVLMGNHLLCDADRRPPLHMNFAIRGFELPHHQFENRALSGAVLPHDRQLTVLADGKTCLFENRLG